MLKNSQPEVFLNRRINNKRKESESVMKNSVPSQNRNGKGIIDFYKDENLVIASARILP